MPRGESVEGSERSGSSKPQKSRSRSRTRRKKADADTGKKERRKKKEKEKQKAVVEPEVQEGDDASDLLEYGPRDEGDDDGGLVDQVERERVEEADAWQSPETYVTLHHIRNLSPDPSIVLPLVRFWVVDGSTGKDIPQLLRVREHEKLYPHPQEGDEAAAPPPLELPPAASEGFFVTPCDLRETKNLCPKWDQRVGLGFNAKEITKAFPNAVLLFEVVDCSRYTVQRKPLLRRSYGPSYGRVFSPVCWGYLRLQGLDGSGRNCFGRQRIQLYRAPHKRSFLRSTFLHLWPSAVYPNSAVAAVGADCSAARQDPMVPPLFFTYQQTVNRLDKYPSTLFVTLDTDEERLVPVFLEPPREDLQKWLEECRNVLNPVETAKTGKQGAEELLQPLGDEDVRLDEPIDLPDCARHKGEKCVLPAFLQASLGGGRKGCLALAFSPCGRFLAVAACEESAVEIRVHDALYGPNPGDEGEPAARLACPQVVSFEGHTDTVYSLIWSPSGSHILTCSADTTAKLWNFEKFSAFSWDNYTTIEALAAAVQGRSLLQHGMAEFTFIHPSYVYSAIYHPLGSIVITAGFDNTIRCWSTISGRLVASCTAAPKSWVSHLAISSDGSTLFSADGNSELRLWTVSGLTRGDRSPKLDLWASIPDFKGKGISCLVPNTQAKQLYVWTRVDSCITCISTSTYSRFAQIRQYRGPRFENCAIRGCLSPCGTTLCTGSAAGPVFFWEVGTGEFISHDHAGLDFQHTAPVYAAAWSPTAHRVAFASYSGRLNHVTVWYRPRQEEDVSLVPIVDPSSTQWHNRQSIFGFNVSPHRQFSRRASISGEPSPRIALPTPIPAEPVFSPDPSSEDWMAQIIAHWKNRVQKHSQRVIAAGTAVEIRIDDEWQRGTVIEWSHDGSCVVQLVSGTSATVPATKLRKLRGGGSHMPDVHRSAALSQSLSRTTADILRQTEFMVGQLGSQDDFDNTARAPTVAQEDFVVEESPELKEGISTPVPPSAAEGTKRPGSAWGSSEKQSKRSSRSGSKQTKKKKRPKKSAPSLEA